MTDSHGYPEIPVEHAIEAPATPETKDAPPVVEEETNPMLASLQSFMNSAKEFGTLSRRVHALEGQVKDLSERLEKTTAERDSLRAENGNLKDQVHVLKDDNEYKAEVLERTRGQVSTWMRKHDEVYQANIKAKDELEHAKDERDLSVLEKEDLKRDLEMQKTGWANEREELNKARESWYQQEMDLNETIQRLSVERDRFRDRYDRCKSFAAQIMAMDQQH